MGHGTDAQRIHQKAQEILAEVLSVSPQQVVREARVIRDLGAESIDLLDLRFRLEKAFAIHISKEDLALAFGESLENGEYLDRFTVGALFDYLEQRLVADRA